MIGDPRVPAQEEFLYSALGYFLCTGVVVGDPRVPAREEFPHPLSATFYAKALWLVTPECLRRRSFLLRSRLLFMDRRDGW